MNKTPTTRPHPLGKRSLRLLWDAHSAVGLLLAPLMLVVFTTGILLPWHHTLEAWGEGPARRGPESASLARVLDPVPRDTFEWVEVHAPLGPTGMALVEFHHHEEEPTELWVDGSTGQAHPRRSDLIGQIYGLHFFHQLPGGIYVTGVLGLLIFSAVLSGIGVHLRDLFRRFGRVRTKPERARRADWHTLLGTLLAVPLAILAITGALLGLANPLAGAHLLKTFDGDQTEAFRQMGYDWPVPVGEQSSDWADPQVPALVQAAQAEIPGLDLHWMGIRHIGAEDTAALVYGIQPGWVELGAQVDLSVADRQVLRVSERSLDLPATVVNRWGIAAHFGNWGPGAVGGAIVQWAYVLVALGCVGLGAFGVSLWAKTQKPSGLRRGVTGTTVFSTAGLFAAMSLGLASRQLGELGGLELPWVDSAVLYGAWVASGVLIVVKRAGRSAVWLLGVSAGALVLAGVLSAFAVPESSWSLAVGRPMLLAVDLSLLLGAACCAALAWALNRRLEVA